MNTAVIIIGLILVILFVFFFIFILKISNDNKQNLLNLKYLKEELKDTGRNIDHKLLEQQRDMRDNVKYQFDKSQQLISEITRELTEVKEGNKQVFNMTEQLSNLEKVLTNQKQRGNWGEE